MTKKQGDKEKNTPLFGEPPIISESAGEADEEQTGLDNDLESQGDLKITIPVIKKLSAVQRENIKMRLKYLSFVLGIELVLESNIIPEISNE